MKTSSTQTFAAHFDPSIPEITVSFAEKDVEKDQKQSGKKKAPPTRCLLLGFDTEYQVIDPVGRKDIESGKAHNEILSYQFCIKLISKGGKGDEPEVEGIIVPVGDKRIDIQDFVSFAIGSFATTYRDVQIPADIYLIGHFTRADLPAFSEFTNPARTFLSNVRNTFVSIDSFIPIEVEDSAGTAVATLRLHLRDTLLLAPANAKSLADIGEIVGLEKISLAPTRAQDLQIKTHMKEFREASWDKFREYAIRDAQVCVRYAEQVVRQYDALFDEFKLPITLTQFGSKLVLDGWSADGLNSNTLLGREKVTEKSFSKKLGYVIQKVTNPFIEEVYWEAPFVTETYHGGRNEQFSFGISPEGKWRDHDLSSAYTTAMSLIGTPDWTAMERLTEFGDVDPLGLAFYSVDFEFPDGVRFPTLPVRTPSGIIFPLRGRSNCSAPEVYLAQNLGAKLSFRRGVMVPADPTKPIFLKFIRSCIEKRGEHKKGSFGNLFWKEVGNSTYGKTAQGLREKRVYDLRADDMAPLPESRLTQPFFASFITSFTRSVLGEILNGFPSSVDVFSVTTDGFLSNASDKDIDRACSGKMFETFSKGRKKLDGSAEPLEIKHQIKQPIGWRTRGSATLKKGDGTKDNIVLQKGGIKVVGSSSMEDENRHVIDLFLNRHPEQKLEYTVAVGLKDMVRFDADFVNRSVTKRLSMEFDWKRQPVREQDVSVTFEGKKYTHLSFEPSLADDTFHHRLWFR